MEDEDKQVSIGQLLEESDYNIVNGLCEMGQWDKLREYLNRPDVKEKLRKRGVVADFLFYFLQHEVTKAEEIE